MSRDYKPSPERTKKTGKGSPFFAGFLVGVLLGVGASLAVVMYINGIDSPFTSLEKPAKPISEKIAETAKTAKTQAETNNNQEDNVDDKTRFDFYTILPGTERKVTPEEIKIKEEPQAITLSSYFLQVGAFATEEDADNMKAKLALLGFEAQVQTATIPNKGILHRVRVGPLDNLDQINKSKAELSSNGFKADLIKVDNENQ
ncbi:MAG: SPOR domain-containing protein [Methylotenera sp.]|nr:SPOR domain-containing protein [Methylotenera sp.]